jgi:hypothetical protein
MKPHHFKFDFLENIEYTSGLYSATCLMDVKLMEFKLKNPNVDTSEQQKTIDFLNELYIYLYGIQHELDMVNRSLLNYERVNLELKYQVEQLKKELETLKQIDNF